MKRLFISCLLSIFSFGAYASDSDHGGQSGLDFDKHLGDKFFGGIEDSISKIQHSIETSSFQDHSSSKSKFGEDHNKKDFSLNSQIEKSYTYDPRWEREFERNFWNYKRYSDNTDWGREHGFNCVDPVPEPETSIIMLLGLLVIGFVASRKRIISNISSVV